MKNILLIFRNDLKHLTVNAASVLIALGLILLPSAFAWSNIAACWDVFDNTGNLKVAVANSDEGYQSDLMPLKLNMGEQVISSLRANDQLDWVFVSEDEAVEGTKAGDYYAAVVIPQNFSRDMMTFYANDAAQVELDYYINEKKNGIAPKITDQGADRVSYQINEVFSRTITEAGLGVVVSLRNYADSANAQAYATSLKAQVDAAATQMRQAAQIVTLYAGLFGSTQAAIDSQYQNVLVPALDALEQALHVEKPPAADDAPAEPNADAPAEGVGGAEGAEGAGSADGAIGAGGAEDAEDAEGPAEKDDLKQDVEDAKQDIEQDADAVIEHVKSEVAAIKADLSSAIAAASSKASAAQTDLKDTASRLSSSAQRLGELSQAIDQTLEVAENPALDQLLGQNPETLASTLAAPVQLDRHAVFPAQSFGAQMSPLYATLALWIGSILLIVAIRPAPSKRAQDDLPTPPTSSQMFIGRFGIFAALSTAQSLTLGLGNLLVLGMHAAHPALYLLAFWVIGMVFAFIMYTLVVSFANLGKAIAVLLLIMQITTADGSYPLPLLPDVFQAISPLMPATHAIAAMRAALMGTYLGDFWMALGALALFIIPFALLGLALRKPLVKFLNWYIEKVEESKLVA